MERLIKEKRLRKKLPMKRTPKNINHSTLKKLALAIAITLLAAVLYTMVADKTQEAKQRIKLEQTTIQLKKVKTELETQKVLDAQQAAEQQQKLDAVNKQLEDTRKQLEAKRKAATVYAAEARRSAPRVAAPSGSCASWMAQAGIPSTYATNKLILNESGCRPSAVNPSSGACGIPQALPCSKMGCSLSDPVCQLKWMDRYVKDRYGTWEAALAAWNSRYPHWY